MMSDVQRRGREPKEKDKPGYDERPLWGASGHDDDAEVRLVGNHIYYYAPISTKPVATLIDALHTLSNKQRVLAIENGGEPQPIVLHINSGGGSIFAGVAAMDAVRLCLVPVHAVVDGMCASAATFPFMVAAKRTMNASAYMLIHQLSSMAWGKYEEMKDDMQNAAQFMRLIRKVYLRHTNIKRQRLDKILKKDLWFDSDKCLKLGMVDKVV
jgi:ATP-dependent protease ClpP protease subunit